MAKTRDYLDYLDETIEMAPANSEEEYQAASTIAQVMSDHGLDATIEEFENHPFGTLMPHVLAIVMFVCLLVCGLTEGPVHVVATLLTLAAIAGILVSHFMGNVFESFGPAARSQNVVAVHHAEGDKVVRGARPIVIVAHYDTPRESFLWKGPLAPMQSVLKKSAFVFAIVVAVTAFLQLLGFIPQIARTFFWVVGIIASIPLLFLAVSAFFERHSACTAGANDNKASVAALLGVLNKVRPGEDRVPESTGERPGRRRASDKTAPQVPHAPKTTEVVEEVKGVRHGRTTLESLGILPPSCELVYEEPKVKIVEEAAEEIAVQDLGAEADEYGDAAAAAGVATASAVAADLADEELSFEDEMDYDGDEMDYDGDEWDDKELDFDDEDDFVDEPEESAPSVEEHAEDDFVDDWDEESFDESFDDDAAYAEESDKSESDDEFAYDDFESEGEVEEAEEAEAKDDDAEDEYEDYEDYEDYDDEEDFDGDEWDDDDEAGHGVAAAAGAAGIGAWFSGRISAIREFFASRKKDKDVHIERGESRLGDDEDEDLDYFDENDDEWADDNEVEDAEIVEDEEYVDDEDAEADVESDSDYEEDDLEYTEDEVDDDYDEEELVDDEDDLLYEEDYDEDLEEEYDVELDDEYDEDYEDEDADDFVAEAEDSYEEVGDFESEDAYVEELEAEIEEQPEYDEETQDAEYVEDLDGEYADDFESDYDDDELYADYDEESEDVYEEEAEDSYEDDQAYDADEQVDEYLDDDDVVEQDDDLNLEWIDEEDWDYESDEELDEEEAPIEDAEAEDFEEDFEPEEELESFEEGEPLDYEDDHYVTDDSYEDEAELEAVEEDEYEEYGSEEDDESAVEYYDAEDEVVDEDGRYEDDQQYEDDQYVEEEPLEEELYVEDYDEEEADEEADPYAYADDAATGRSLGSRIKGIFGRKGRKNEGSFLGEPEVEQVEEAYEEEDYDEASDYDDFGDYELEEYDSGELEEETYDEQYVPEDYEEFEQESELEQEAEYDQESDVVGESAYEEASVYVEEDTYDEEPAYEEEPASAPFEGEAWDSDATEATEPVQAEPVQPLRDPNLLHFDYEQDEDIAERDTTGLDTITYGYDLYSKEQATRPERDRPKPIDDPNWGSSSYQPPRPVINIARRAALFDLPDPTKESMDPFADNLNGNEDEGSSSSFWGEGGATEQSSTSDWKGGAAIRSDLRGSSGAPLVIDADDLQDAILEMGDEFLVAHDIWFVATGASAIDHAGIKAFVMEHRRDIRGSFLVNLESVGSGELSLLTEEGLGATRHSDRRIVRMLSDIAHDLHIRLNTSSYDWNETEAASAMRARLRAVTIAGLDNNGLPSMSHTSDDVPDNVNPKQVSEVVRLITELIRRA